MRLDDVLQKRELKFQSLQGIRMTAKNEVLDGTHIMRFGYLVGPHLALPMFLQKNRYDVVIVDLGHAVPWISPVLLRKEQIVEYVK